MSSTRRSVESGVNGDGLMTTVQPTRMAGMMCQTAISIGQFHGVIDATTPTGLRCTTMLAALVVLNRLLGNGQAGRDARPCHGAADFQIRAGAALGLALLARNEFGQFLMMLFDQIGNRQQFGDALGIGQRGPRAEMRVARSLPPHPPRPSYPRDRRRRRSRQRGSTR